MMDLQSRKISFVQEFLDLQNEEIISLFEKLLRWEKKKLTQKELTPMTFEELNKRIDTALEDSKNGRLTESDKLLSEIEKWR